MYLKAKLHTPVLFFSGSVAPGARIQKIHIDWGIFISPVDDGLDLLLSIKPV